MSKRDWTPIEAAFFDKVAGSGCSYDIPDGERPFQFTAPQFSRLLLYAARADESALSAQTTATMYGRLVTQRYDPKDYPEVWNYNWHLLVRAANGMYFMSRPRTDMDFSHWMAEPLSSSSLKLFGAP